MQIVVCRFGHCVVKSFFDLRILVTPLVSSNSSYHRVCNKSNKAVLLVKQELLTLLGSTGVTLRILVGFVLLDLNFLCNILYIIFCPFSFDQCLVRPYQFTASDYLFGIFKLSCIYKHCFIFILLYKV